MEDKRQATALFRYSLIRELADPELGPRQRGARIRALSATDHAFDGQRVEVTGPSLRRWLRNPVESVHRIWPKRPAIRLNPYTKSG